jgi:hypothetical protein
MSGEAVTFRLPTNADSETDESSGRPDTVASIPETVSLDDEAAFDGSLAATMRARAERLAKRTKEFSVPPWDVWGNDLVMVAQPVRLREGMSYVQLIIDATAKVLYRDDATGDLQEIPDGWAGVAKIMGLGENVTLGQVVKRVCGSEEALGVGLAEPVMAFIVGRRSQIEQALGE